MAITNFVKKSKIVKPLIRYSWIRARAGYEWISVNVPQQEFIEGNKRVRPKPESDFLLVEADRVTRSPEYGFYETPADLFKEFASTEETKEGVKAFADEFGQLGFQKSKGRTSFADDSVSGHDWGGELLSWWCRAIANMRNAIALWKAIEEARNGDDSSLSGFVRWFFVGAHPRAGVSIPGRQRTWFGRELQNLKMRAGSSDKTHGQWTRGDLIRPAQEFLREELTSRLAGSLSIGLDWNEAHSGLVRSFRPNSLLALLWLQFADALTGETEFRHCKRKGCGKLIRISGERGWNTNKETCSDSCKVQVYQERVRTVIESFDQGKTPEEIATSSKTEPSMVRKWIARELGKRGDTVATISSRLRVKPGEVRKFLEKKARIAR
ncbi:hypothetical protein [Candidatus Binatus sp.]|uniref:hypothetical protein n=1 Tax=Candidatus Binatus sp. TaxID=2811406 RepID=UPI003C8BAC0A